MAALNLFNCFGENLVTGVHVFGTSTFKLLLTNTVPVATNTVKTDITEIAAGNGYTAGGNEVTCAVSRTTNVTKILITDEVITATGAIGPYRYGVVYDDTSATDALVGWIDLGQNTMANLDTDTVDFDGSAGAIVLTV